MYKQKLIDLLKSDEQVKKAMEKLEFGCSIKIIELGTSCLQEYGRDDGIFGEEFYIVGYNDLLYPNDLVEYDVEQIEHYISGKVKLPDEIESIEIIGLPLQERFIRMYCENKGNMPIFKADFDDTKDFDNQEDEVYQRIYKALLELN